MKHRLGLPVHARAGSTGRCEVLVSLALGPALGQVNSPRPTLGSGRELALNSYASQSVPGQPELRAGRRAFLEGSAEKGKT